MTNSNLANWLILCIFLYFIINPSTCSDDETDLLALLSFKAKVIDARGALESWISNGTTVDSYCSWRGVSCSTRHRSRVTSIDLDSQGLTGPLSPHLGNLSFLRHISLRNNSFSGPIPQEFGRLRRLAYIEISNNSFSGEIPRNLSQCRNLYYLNLIDNELTGIIPPELSSLSKLEDLGLSDNILSGNIPSFIGNFTSLEQLSLSNCGLHGEIPEPLVNLRKLIRLTLDTNELTGTIPSGLFNISTIRYFLVFTNKLRGNIPPDIGLTLPNLRHLSLGDNNFTGSLPVSLSNASFLEIVEIFSNRFTGPMPTNLGSLSNLRWFSVFSTYVEDDIGFLSSLTNCTSLQVVLILDNILTGSLPVSISNLTTRLTKLAMEMNQLHGPIPSGIGNLVGLTSLTLFLNHFSGPIPSTIGKLKKLQRLNLSANRFTNELPSSLGNLTLLNTLYLTRNNISGSVPTSLVNCVNLLQLDFSRNNLSGPIPKELMSLSSLSVAVDLSDNAFSGSIPAEIGSLRNLAWLDLSNNRLSGLFPNTISSCTNLQWLYVENNSFYGEIPQGMSDLRGLLELELSTNNFSGPIPRFLAEIPLQLLNLSFNRLQGPVPNDGIFRNQSAFSVEGNADLCGGIPELKLPPCPLTDPETKKNSSISLKVLIPIVVSGAVFISLVACWYILVRRKKKSIKNLYVSSFESKFRRLSYADLLRATSGFSEDNVVGKGRFSTVYKGILDDGETTVAVKVLNLQVRGAVKSFESECKALRVARHRNLLKILSISVSIDFQMNDFMALIFRFKASGSLEEWLHQSIRYIPLMKRVDIAIDIASAVEYLHNGTGSNSAIVHGDLKPSNVLLDDDMTAHVGDFGLAKVISDISTNFAADESASSIAVKGTIGYIAPEYGMSGVISTQGDVYSYGILLLEMFTNVRPTSEALSSNDQNLHSYVRNCLPNRSMEVLDPFVVLNEGDTFGTSVINCVASVFGIGVACSREHAHDRISMADVVIELKRIKAGACSNRGLLN
ncbi:hypothetical protein ABFS83_09G081600 [Erythranthe nasuta]